MSESLLFGCLSVICARLHYVAAYKPCDCCLRQVTQEQLNIQQTEHFFKAYFCSTQEVKEILLGF